MATIMTPEQEREIREQLLAEAEQQRQGTLDTIKLLVEMGITGDALASLGDVLNGQTERVLRLGGRI